MKAAIDPVLPAPLRCYVEHASQFADTVAHALRTLVDSPLRGALRRPGDAGSASDVSDAEVWLMGRDDEARTVTLDVLDDWRRGLLDEREASGAIHAYLVGVHHGLAAAIRAGAPPACCVPRAAAGSAPSVWSAASLAQDHAQDRARLAAAMSAREQEVTRVAELASRLLAGARPTPATVTSETRLRERVETVAFARDDE